ncbi:MAG: apolipoprotein N-acyltransferase [Kineosporiaceae bacterium]
MTTTAPPPVDAAPATPGGVPRGAGPARALPLALAGPLAVGGGVLLDVAFPGIGFWPAALVAPGLLLLAVRGRGPAAGYGLAVLFGLGFMVPHLQWSGTYVGAMPWLALATSQALILGLVGLLWPACWRLASRPRLAWTLPVTAPAVWVAVEALRGRAPFDGLSWARVGFSQSDSPLVWLSALAGVPAVSGAVVAVSAALALVTVGLLRRAGTGGPGARGAVTAATATVAVTILAAGAGFLANDAVRATTAGTVTVAAVQGNVPTPGLDFNAERRAVTDNHARATEQLAEDVAAGRTPPVDLVVWPENSSDIDPLRNADAAGVISGATDAVGVPVLVGAVLREGESNVNAMLVWEPGSGYRGDADGRYAKQDVVPFAEYIPFRDFFRRITPLVDEVPRDFAPGPGPGVLEVAGTTLGPVICFEVSRDGLIAEQVRLGADLLAVPTNNATFGFSDESTQQIVMSRLRAVEHGRSVVHASTVGVSGVFSPDGSSTRWTELFTQDVVVAEVPLHTGLTPAARLGEWPELVVSGAVALAGIGLLVAGARRRLARRGDGKG